MDTIIKLIEEWSRLQRLTPTIQEPVKVLQHRAKLYIVFKELESHGVSRFVSDVNPEGDWYINTEMR